MNDVKSKAQIADSPSSTWPTGIHRQLDLIQRGQLDRFVVRLKSGALVMGETQPLIGYCLLLADPVVPHFNALTQEARAQWALDLGAIGDALLEESGILRVNYETWGNLDPALHTHIVPRSKFEDAEKGRLPAREAYDYAKSPRFDLKNVEHRNLLERLRARLRHLAV
ncbi:MAG TPA: hypothetical protein PLZ57_06000 [Pseudobdellovibrionaceae bacterium]|nr:hypothetical protein [Pseudobdellovibrionaceae bacterium]